MVSKFAIDGILISQCSIRLIWYRNVLSVEAIYNKILLKCNMFAFDYNPTIKSFYANLTKAILGIELDKEIEEFEKAEIIFCQYEEIIKNINIQI